MTQLTAPANVIVFGETGAGKSSLINLIVGKDVAEISSKAMGCTFESKSYEVEVKGIPLVLWDTSGLNEGEKGQVAAKKAIGQVYHLIQSMENNGVSLLVFCVRGPRITETTIKNYQLFYSTFCLAKVPIALVVTGLENEEPMDAWWPENKDAFDNQGMMFHGHACITATKGKIKEGRYIHEEEFEESRVKVRKLIVDTRATQPWRMNRVHWFIATVKQIGRAINGMLGFSLFDCSQSVYELLKHHAEFSDKELRAAADEIGKNEAA
jgi:GTPase Era involved in 16S rRNA processing